MAKETAEQKLLKIIESTQSPKTSSAKQKSESNLRKFFSFQKLNQLLFVLIIAACAYLAWEIQKGVSLLNKNIEFSVDASGQNNAVGVFMPEIKDLGYYLDQVSLRNIFKPYEGKEKVGEQGIAQRMSKFKIVGIAWLDLPESASVMIEDTKSGTTYFLKTGEKFEDITVKTIYTDRVLFTSANEEIIIKL